MEVDEDVECETKTEIEEPGPSKNVKRSVYLPGKPLKKGEELVCDPSAYHMLHEAQTGAPCLSFDIIPDNLGSGRENFPHTAYVVAGTQAERVNANSVIVMKVSNLSKMKHDDSNSDEIDSDKEDDDDDDDEDNLNKLPIMDSVLIKHHGCVNRIRAASVNGRNLAAIWSEMGKVTLIDMASQLQAIENPALNTKSSKKGPGEPIKPLFVFNGHLGEGYGIDWCPTQPGVLATGDTKKNIHIWTPLESTWRVDQRPLLGHTASVEDLQWSPTERHVLASCSVDKSLRIWDTRLAGAQACKLVVENAHASDVNVISWNRTEPLIASGGDDGFLYVWDLRNFKTGEAVAVLKHHSDYLTSVEWNPHESSVLASSGADNQIAIWDLAVEKDDSGEEPDELKDLPPQLLFIHQGQVDIKELHWHNQIPGMMISTANSGFNFFRTISV